MLCNQLLHPSFICQLAKPGKDVISNLLSYDIPDTELSGFFHSWISFVANNRSFSLTSCEKKETGLEDKLQSILWQFLTICNTHQLKLTVTHVLTDIVFTLSCVSRSVSTLIFEKFPQSCKYIGVCI